MNDSRKVFISRKQFTEARKKRHLTITDVADEAHIEYETLRPCLRHEKIMPDHLDSIAQVLNTTPEYLQGKNLKKAELQAQLVSVKNDDVLPVFYDMVPLVDSNGYEIPTYSQHEQSSKASTAKESLFSFVNCAMQSKVLTEEFFEENYDEILDIFAPAVFGLANYIKNKTGRFVILQPLKERKK